MTVANKPIPFASWERVSTEDRQDPESSRAWQHARGKALIEPHGGVIVAEFFDIDKSRPNSGRAMARLPGTGPVLAPASWQRPRPGRVGHGGHDSRHRVHAPGTVVGLVRLACIHWDACCS
jgi:hypothetical protein